MAPFLLLIAMIIPQISISYCFSPLRAESVKPTGFSAHIFHIDSIRSPFYNPNLTRADRIRAAVRRSYAREQYYIQATQPDAVSPNEIAAPARPENKEYMMEFFVGKQVPTKSYGIIDTGSGIFWLQCHPCDGCPKQPFPLFDPAKSTSYERVTCREVACRRIPDYRCTDDDFCQFSISYADKSYSEGDIAYETVRFRDNNMRVGNYTWQYVLIGCSHEYVDPTPVDVKAPGIIGLDRSPSSLIRQFVNNMRFAYCLGSQDDVHPDGYIKFGDAAPMRGSKTPMLALGRRKDFYYYLDLQGISVDDWRLPIPNDTFTYKPSLGRGGFVIDSGAPFTLLNRTAFNLLSGALEKKLGKKHFKDAEDELEVCYIGTATDFVHGPAITFHFPGVDFKLATWSTWVIREDDIYCLSIVPSDSLFVLGNFNQQNVEVGYDLDNNLIYFNSLSSCSDLGF